MYFFANAVGEDDLSKVDKIFHVPLAAIIQFTYSDPMIPLCHFNTILQKLDAALLYQLNAA